MMYIGRIEITYQAVSSSSITLSPGETLATPGEDFDNSTMTIMIEDSEASATIVAPIIDVS